MNQVRSLVILASIVLLGACSKTPAENSAQASVIPEAPQLLQVTRNSDPQPRIEVGVKNHLQDEALIATNVAATPTPAASTPQAAAANAAPASIVCKVGSPDYGAGAPFLAANSCGSFIFQPGNCVRGDNGNVNAYPDSRYHGVVSSFWLQGGMNSFRINQPTASTLPGGALCCGGGNGTGACYGMYFEVRFDRLAN